jgi:glutathione-regulated potassium-efflux system ancillary protein KefG
MLKVLVLFAHPTLEQSVVNKKLIKRLHALEHVSVRDLYELYPDFDIPVKVEQAALERHDIIIWLHPIYWYAAPPIIKQWIDLVLLHDWAYGANGVALKGKLIFNMVTTGSTIESYQAGGHHGYPLADFLLPYRQTAHLCHMEYLPPYVIDGAFTNDTDTLMKYIDSAVEYIRRLQTGACDLALLKQMSYSNHLSDHR